MSRSPTSCPRSGSDSASFDPAGLEQAALWLLLFATGAQTPLLALVSLRRTRNLVAVVAPYAALLAVIVTIGGALDAATRVGAVALVLSPAALAAPGHAEALGARRETAGALLAGSLLASFALLLVAGPSLGQPFATASTGLFALLLGAAFAAAVPTLRDALLRELRWTADVASAGILLLAFAGVLGVRAQVSAVTVLVPLGVLALAVALSASLARLTGREASAVAVGAGTRDGAVAAALAVQAGGFAAAAVPVTYWVLLELFLIVWINGRRRRRGAWRSDAPPPSAPR